MKELRKYLAEFIGTCVLVLVACGVAGQICATGVSGLIGTALAFGLVIVAMAYSIGNISGCHINPAVSVAMLISKKISVKDFCGYIVAQFLGAIAGAAILNAIVQEPGRPRTYRLLPASERTPFISAASRPRQSLSAASVTFSHTSSAHLRGLDAGIWRASSPER